MAFRIGWLRTERRQQPTGNWGCHEKNIYQSTFCYLARSTAPQSVSSEIFLVFSDGGEDRGAEQNLLGVSLQLRRTRAAVSSDNSLRSKLVAVAKIRPTEGGFSRRAW